MIEKTGIILFVYNRPYHTRKVLEGLKYNNISNLYIFSDGPRGEGDNTSVKEVRNLIANIDWCETEIHINPENKGLSNSVIDGVNYILSKHERVIALEDDCVPSPDFTYLMEACFDRYEKNERIMSVSGFSLPIEIPENYKYDIYFSYRPCSYGWGTWKRAWDFFDRDESFIYQIKKSVSFRQKVIRAGDNLIPMIESQLTGKIDSWAVFWCLSVIRKEGICISPVKSRIKNLGFDGSGVHCKKISKFDVELPNNYNKRLKFPEDIELNGKIIREIRRFYSIPFRKKTDVKVKKLLKTIGLYDFLRNIKHKTTGEKNENCSS